MITIFTQGKKEVFPEVLRPILIKEYEEAQLRGFSAGRNKFAVESLKSGRDRINLLTLTAE